jgi:hypothetical protein
MFGRLNTINTLTNVNLGIALTLTQLEIYKLVIVLE